MSRVLVVLRGGLAIAALAGRDVVAQGPPRTYGGWPTAAAGLAMYAGTGNEQGFGLAGGFGTRLGKVYVDLTAVTLRVIGQTCTAGIPSVCSPNAPPSPQARLSVEYVFQRGHLYASLGPGLWYRDVTAARDDVEAAASAHIGLGLGPRVVLELMAVTDVATLRNTLAMLAVRLPLSRDAGPRN